MTGPVGNCVYSEAQVNDAFIAGAPLIAEGIIDLTVQNPRWFSDMYTPKPWPTGHGTMMEQLVFRGSLPQTEEGFDNWRLQDNNTGCDPCEGPDCGYNWTVLGGHSLDRKVIRLMDRDYRSAPFCVKKIQTTYQFETLFPQIIRNLYRQIDFIKEINLGQNFMTGIAKKFVVDSGGIKPNTENPYVYRPAGTAVLSAPTIQLLQFFYEQQRMMPDAIPFDTVDGHPIFAAVASPELFRNMELNDPSLRKDIRFSSEANALLGKYNFLGVLGGMYLPVPFLYPRRFRYDSVANQWIRISPWVNGVPAEAGTFSAINQNYIDPNYATHEEILLHGRNPFEVYYMPTVRTLGAGSDFGPEPGFFDNWMWVNPQTIQDPGRRVGFYWTHASIGISAQYSESVLGLLVPRLKPTSAVSWWPTAVCPPTEPACDNTVPDVGCPCPMIVSVTVNPVNGTEYIVTLAAPVDAEAEDDVQFGLTTGGYVTGTVVAISEDGKNLEVTFAQSIPACDLFSTIFCDNTLGCSAQVLKYSVNCTDNTRLDLILSHPIKAVDAADSITIYYGDGTSATVTVVSVDMVTNTWVVDVGGTAFCDNLGGVVSVCVPTATDATCPACGNAAVGTQCVEEA